MAEIGKNKNRKEEKFKIVILDDQTYEEKLAFRMKRRFIIPGVLFLFAFTLGISLIIISFTPLKMFVPGYANIENNTYVIKMNKYVSELEQQLTSQEKYNEAIQKLLQGIEENESIDGSKTKNNNQQVAGTKNNSGNTKDYNAEIDKKTSGTKKIGVQYLNAPMDGQIIHPVNFRKGHYGIDIAGKKNSAIKAVMEGVVILADYSIETGYTLALQHPNNMVSVYKHNEKLLKKIGYFVSAGEAIAILGNTGTLTDGPHLHFELWYKSTPLNPADYIIF